MKEIVIALAGNPNCGKTSVFNALTGMRQKVGNWPGVTVEHVEGTAKHGDTTFKVVDLPGIYSLSSYSQEEIISRDYILDEKPDVIVDVVDADNIERNLYLTTQLAELKIPMVIALNMVDLLEKSGRKIDIKKFSDLLGVPTVPIVATHSDKTGKTITQSWLGVEGGMDVLLETVEKVAGSEFDLPRSAQHINEIEDEIEKLSAALKVKDTDDIPLRWLLVKTLEGDAEARNRLLSAAENPDVAVKVLTDTENHIKSVMGDDLETIIADGRYGFIEGLLRETMTVSRRRQRRDMTQKIDKVLLNRVLGIPIFLVMMFASFWVTFNLGGFLQGYIEIFFDKLSAYLSGVMPDGLLSGLVIDGIIGGVGGVITFFPIILILFIILCWLEDSGYMARAAFLMDMVMHKFGLHGRSFIPMIMGFGCSVPAVMTARTLNTNEDRLITIFITPLMSCTARLPVYALFVGLFFSKNGALVILSLYALGVLLAVISGKLFRKTLFKNAPSPFVMELPPYRMPTFKGTMIHAWEKTHGFIMKAGTVILASAVIIWALATLPYGVEYGSADSLAGKLGMFFAPVMKPLGIGWQGTVALIFGLSAKEVVVGSLEVLYGSNAAIGAAFTPLTAYVFMAFCLIYIPCIACVATIRRETASLKWTIFSCAYLLVLAYVVSLLIRLIGTAMGF